MDSLTQAALGAAVGEAVLGKKIGHKAAILGAIVGTIPDLDVFLTLFYDAFEKITIHRGYSHSIFLSIIGAFLIAFILSRIKWTKEISYRRLWMFTFLVWFTHILLDAFTSYGTQLLLPFTDWRVSFDSITIVDPIYTLPLLLGVGISIWKFNKDDEMRSLPNNIGLLVSSLYLLFTLANKEHIEYVFSDQLREQNLPHFNLLTVPVKVANYEWYGVAKDRDNLYIGKYSEWKNNKIEFHKFPINDHLLDDVNSQLTNRLKWFAQGFYTVAEKDGLIRVYNMQCDMQGVRTYGDYEAPTAFYYEIDSKPDGSYKLSSGMHMTDGTNDMKGSDAVISIGAMKSSIPKGKLQGVFDLSTLSNLKHVYGLGPVEYLKGELLINNGKSYISRVTSDTSMSVEKSFDVKAPFFVYSEVPEWEQSLLPDHVQSIKDLESHLNLVSKDRKGPFAFRLTGIVRDANIHVVNLPNGSKVSSHEEAHVGQINYQLENSPSEIIGFYSKKHRGVFTHHDSNVHMHLITDDELQMGHLEDVRFEKGSMKIFFPKE